MALPDVPRDFTDLDTAYQSTDVQYNAIGICVDFLPAAQSRGSDFTMKFTLSDPRWVTGIGMGFRFFNKDPKQLPCIQKQGDVLILRNIRTKVMNGDRMGLSNSATSWLVLEHSSVVDSKCPNGSDISVHQSGTKSFLAPMPNVFELRYAKRLSEAANPGSWPCLPPPPPLRTAPIVQENGGMPIQLAGKYRLLSDLLPPSGSAYVFAELFGEVRKMYQGNDRVELSLTDYTKNDFLYNYKHGSDEDGADGDDFGYVPRPSTKWPGPWGKMSMDISLWPPHAEFARNQVREGCFVYLRNVKIKWDPNLTKIEGHCHGDQRYVNKINVEVFKPREAEGNEKFKELLRRKRDYEAKAKAENLDFTAQVKRKQASDNKLENATADPKSKKNRERKKRLKAKARGLHDDGETPVASTQPQPKSLQLNSHVRCNNVDIPLKTVRDILDPSTLRRTTPAGNQFSVPFQNCCYKTKVRVVNYFPDNIADFAAPVRSSEYDTLSDHGSDGDTDVIMTHDYSEGGSNSDSDDGGRQRVKWEWRFFLLVEDAQSNRMSKGVEIPPQMQLLVADTDGDYLLKTDACDFRAAKNANALAALKEKLFVLWGDLAEQKEEATAAAAATGVSVKPKAMPFECFIKEYGVPARKDRGGRGEHTVAPNGETMDYERMFRLCYTTI